MDELNNSFGRLSTNAPEWKPSVGNQATDLNASKVKEFVPGQGWSSVTAAVDASGGVMHPNATPGPASAAYTDEHAFPEGKHQEPTIPAPTGAPPAYNPPFRALHSLGVSDELWRHFRDQSLQACRQMDPMDPRHKAIPLPYCNAYCLDSPHAQSTRSSYGYPASTFQVTNREDGYQYCLRRFDNCRTVSIKIAAAVTDRWTNPTVASVQDHPNIVRFYQCFVAQRAVFFVHQLVPGAQTLQERLLYMQQHHHQHPHMTNQSLLPEKVIWSCVVQLVSAISVIHTAGLAVRSLDAAHVLVHDHPSTARWRIRISCGVVDALEFETRRHIHDWQQLDLRALGQLIVTMATAGQLRTTPGSPNYWVECETILAQQYSRELHNLAMTLLRSGANLNRSSQAAPPPPPSPSIRDVSRAIWAHIQAEHDETYTELDIASTSLAAEYDSSRALRLLLKLGFVNERPEFGPNRRWSQTGDCYVISLFRDYVFHQADGAGYPVMDLGHVVTALNKLDAADPEKIVLASRDGVSLMVVSFADVARTLDSAFLELCAGNVSPTMLQY